MHQVDKGKDLNVRPENQVIKPIISTEVKGMTQRKPRLEQGRAGIKRKIKPHKSPQLSKAIQMTGKQILLQPQNTAQQKQYQILDLIVNKSWYCR